jgi:ABC-type transport system involved in multi-copper enzyme maturation permease subunit
MTTIESSPTRAEMGWQRLDERLGQWSDRLNPILIKEARQAIRSRQFVATFLLLLLGSWVFSMLYLAYFGPAAKYGALGRDLFYGYMIGLSGALLVVVPFGAFRSLAGEREDRTYELVTITGLSPRQIVLGKLSGAALQMLVYLSAMAPCVAFTYLLRGIDVWTILFVLFWLIAASLAFSLLALLVAAATRERHWQAFLGVGVAVGLVFSLMGTIGLLHEILSHNLPFADREFWLANLAMITAYVSTFVLVLQAVAAQLTFEADNRSTGLRITMVVQQALFAGWMGWIYLVESRGDREVVMVFAMLSGMYWWVLGSTLTGESPDLSARVRRGLPQSRIGRLLGAWLQPGPGTGFMLMVATLGAVVLLTVLGVEVSSALRMRPGWGSAGAIQLFAVTGYAYTIVYVGIGKLLLDSLRKVARFAIVLPVLLQTVMLAIGCGLPMILEMYKPSARQFEYSVLQTTNVFWTLAEIIDRRGGRVETAIVATIVGVAAVMVLLFNLPAVVRELRRAPLATPSRVLEDQAEVEARQAPPPGPKSPWDEQGSGVRGQGSG